MTFDEWFEAAHPVTSLTNMSLRFAHHELARLAWEAALSHHEPAQAQVTEAMVEAALDVWCNKQITDVSNLPKSLRDRARAALEAAARARGTGEERG